MRDPEGRFRISRGAIKAPNGIAPITAFLAVAVLLIGVLASILFLSGRLSSLPVVRLGSNDELARLWEAQEYGELIESADLRLEEHTLDYESLILSGFAYFYLGIDQIDTETQLDYMTEAVIRLRKAKLHGRSEMQSELNYILGKSYFHKGVYYDDLAIEYLSASLDDGYISMDTHEYLALAHARRKEYEESVYHLERAVELNPEDLLYYTLGTTRMQIGHDEEAQHSFREAVRITSDEYLKQQSQIRLGELLKMNGDYDAAEEQMRLVLRDNPQAADAHFILGEIYSARGDRERARYEWREAVRIEPRHVDALQSLQNN
jgi:tetratricopeptide (TPR) repeat protein